MINTETALDIGLARRVAELFSALSDASRVRIIALLLEGEANVGTIAREVDLTISNVSHHLRGLRQMRLVAFRREGRQVFYRLDDDHVEELIRAGLEHARHGESRET